MQPLGDINVTLYKYIHYKLQLVASCNAMQNAIANYIFQFAMLHIELKALISNKFRFFARFDAHPCQ
jgi:hypothetical protein